MGRDRSMTLGIKEKIVHGLQRRGLSPWRDPHNYDRPWMNTWRGFKWYARLWWYRYRARPLRFIALWCSKWYECRDCQHYVNRGCQSDNEQCCQCWIRERGMTPNEWAWSRGWLKANFVTVACWVFDHNEKYENLDGHQHIACLRCRHCRWDDGNRDCLIRAS